MLAALLRYSFFICLLLTAVRIQAGFGPENTILAVNLRSPESLTLANHYQRLRGIPPSHIVYLDIDPQRAVIDINQFRARILDPLLQALLVRGISEQIDAVVYSCGFPTAVDLKPELATAPQINLGPSVVPYAALTGLTYLYLPVIQKNPAVYTQNTSNFYYRDGGAAGLVPPSSGMRTWYGWQPGGKLTESGGARYLPCTMLNVVGKGASTLPDAILGLERAARVDGTKPSGVFLFSQHADVRSTTRSKFFAQTVEELRKLGHQAEIVSDLFPQNQQNVLGMSLGFADVAYVKENIGIAPGAIVENLTSYGAKFGGGHGQPLLTEFLRLGATGSSGTVDEPLANPTKFPHPLLHLHYARGCNLAEAYYQSVLGPWQLLVVGDALCAPWADVPKVLEPNELVRPQLFGKITFTPRAQVNSGKVGKYELYVDGARVAVCGPDEQIELDTKLFADGYHELRIVAIGPPPIESVGRWTGMALFRNTQRELVSGISAERVSPGDLITITAAAPDTKTLVIYCNGRIMHSENKSKLSWVWKVPVGDEIEPGMGTGPLVWRVLAIGTQGAQSHLLGEPLPLTVVPKP